jgi:hypothetical protein
MYFRSIISKSAGTSSTTLQGFLNVEKNCWGRRDESVESSVSGSKLLSRSACCRSYNLVENENLLAVRFSWIRSSIFFHDRSTVQACNCSLQCTDSQLSVPRMCGGSCKFAVVELKDAFQGDRYVSSSWRLSPCIAILFDSFLLWTDVLLSCFYLFSWFFLSSCDYLNTQLKLSLGFPSLFSFLLNSVYTKACSCLEPAWMENP